MADLPERRIDDRDARADHLLVIKVGDQAEQAVTELAHGCDQLAHVHGGRKLAVALEIIVGIWAFVAKNS